MRNMNVLKVIAITGRKLKKRPDELRRHEYKLNQAILNDKTLERFRKRGSIDNA